MQVDDQADDLRHRLQPFNQPPGLRQFAAGTDQTHHNLPGGGRLADINMPQHAGMRLFVIDGQTRFLHIARHDVEDLPEDGRLEQAIPLFDHPMAARGVKPDQRAVRARRHRILRLIAVPVRPAAGDQRLRRHGQPADALKSVSHLLPFIAAFRLIGNVPVNAPAAPAESRTIRLTPTDTVRRRRDQLLDTTESVGLFHLQDAHQRPVPHGGIRHKNHQTSVLPGTGHAAAFRRNAGDFQFYHVIFLPHMHSF